MDRAALHAKTTLTACGLTAKQVRSARVEGNDVVISCLRGKTPHEFSICFTNAAAAKRGRDAVIALKNGRSLTP